jgi:hypothetical protein
VLFYRDALFVNQSIKFVVKVALTIESYLENLEPPNILHERISMYEYISLYTYISYTYIPDLSEEDYKTSS